MSEQVAVDEVAGMVDRLIELSSVVDDDAACIDMIAAVERLKAAAAAFQLEKITQFARSQAEAKKAMGFEARHAMRGVPEQIGLATKVSPSAAARQLTRARALTEHLPETFALACLPELMRSLGRAKISFRTINDTIFGLENVITIYLAARLALDNMITVGMIFAFITYKQQFVDRTVLLVEKVLDLRIIGLHLERLADIALTPLERGHDQHALT
jgi:ABC-type multidrug transport system fused ATPase/permease subunit